MGRAAAVARSLTRQVGRCSSNSDKMRRPLARASTRYSGRSAGSGALLVPGGTTPPGPPEEVEVERSAADEELAVRRGMDVLPPRGGIRPQPTGRRRTLDSRVAGRLRYSESDFHNTRTLTRRIAPCRTGSRSTDGRRWFSEPGGSAEPAR